MNFYDEWGDKDKYDKFLSRPAVGLVSIFGSARTNVDDKYYDR